MAVRSPHLPMPRDASIATMCKFRPLQSRFARSQAPDAKGPERSLIISVTNDCWTALVAVLAHSDKSFSGH